MEVTHARTLGPEDDEDDDDNDLQVTLDWPAPLLWPTHRQYGRGLCAGVQKVARLQAYSLARTAGWLDRTPPHAGVLPVRLVLLPPRAPVLDLRGARQALRPALAGLADVLSVPEDRFHVDHLEVDSRDGLGLVQVRIRARHVGARPAARWPASPRIEQEPKPCV